MPKIVLLQSFRETDVPVWVQLCRESMETLAGDRGWAYRFEGDTFFCRAPDWAKAACADNIWRLSDICRLEWMISELEAGADAVIWSDIDMLAFAPEHIGLDLSRDHGFSHELRFEGASPQNGVNNALMFFRHSSAQIEAYRHACYATLTRGGALARTALGPDLLTSLNITPPHVITGCGILNIMMMQHMLADAHQRLPDTIANALPWSLGAANLCLNERRFFHGAAREEYDRLVESVVRLLLTRRHP